MSTSTATPDATTDAPTAAAEAQPRHPFIELLARYRAIFKAAWDRRDELAGPRRMLDERAFLPAALALQETPPHPAPRRAAIAICALFFIALLWAILGQIDIVAVAQGRIIVSQRSKTIQPLETSVVKAIHVKDGDKVKAGDLLIELDSTLTAADSTRVGEERSAAGSETLRTQALLAALAQGSSPRMAPAALAHLTAADHASAQAQLQSEWADINAKLARYAAEAARRQAEIATAEQLVAKLQATVPLAQQREKDFKALTEQGFVAGHAGQDRTRERIEQERDLATAQARLREAQAALAPRPSKASTPTAPKPGAPCRNGKPKPACVAANSPKKAPRPTSATRSPASPRLWPAPCSSSLCTRRAASSRRPRCCWCWCRTTPKSPQKSCWRTRTSASCAPARPPPSS